MNSATLSLIWLLPLSLLLIAGQRHARWILLVAPLPALFAAVMVPVGSSVSLPWLLLGAELGLDETGRVFLLFSGVLWLAAALYGAGSEAHEQHGTRYRVFFLLAMAGNLGLIVARDMLSFYLGFTLMGLAACGLILHPGTRRARKAARRYLAWTIAGELLLFVAIVMLALQHNGALAFTMLQSAPPTGFVVLLLIIGFGIKLALPGLHLWLPPAYAVTPAPAVAVLSGAMIKAGLLGWLRFLPPGDAALSGWGQVLLVAGVTGIFFGSIVGLLQQQPRLLLGYSSISKMGVLTAGMGAALAWPAAAPALIGALVLYAAHHALVKGALFLGLGLVERGGLRPWLLAGLGLLALVLAGAPLTSGALAKSVLKTSLPAEAHVLVLLLAASAFASTLLMARFMFLVWRQRAGNVTPLPVAAITAWLAILAVIVAFPFAIAGIVLHPADVAPLALGAVLSGIVLLAAPRLPGRTAARNCRTAATQLAVQTSVAIKRTARVIQHLAGVLHRERQNSSRVLQQTLDASMAQLQRPGGSQDHWFLAGSLLLGIGGLLLATFMLAE
jgi:formate hydrogenlyase subunit 3/multisubunit Na+/H+ antiporter MnhD subunit